MTPNILCWVNKIIDKNNNIVMIIERKSLNDLLASVKDGRYNEQSFRLDETPIENNKIFYIQDFFRCTLVNFSSIR